MLTVYGQDCILMIAMNEKEQRSGGQEKPVEVKKSGGQKNQGKVGKAMVASCKKNLASDRALW
jgi:hypothetical protein